MINMTGGINMITKDNLDKIEKCAKAQCPLTIETLKGFGFHIGEIAYLIETGRLVCGQNGTYDYLETRNQNILSDISVLRTSFDVEKPEVLLSLLLGEKKRVEIDTGDPEWKFLEEKSKLLEDKRGIIILKPTFEERRHKIYQFVKAIPCLVAFPIDKGLEKKRVVLKFHIDEQIDITKLMKAGGQAYQRKDFWQSIEYYLEVFSHLRNPSPYLYGKLGLSYMRVGQIKKAIDFLTVADSLSTARKKESRFSDLIEELKMRKGSWNDRKSVVSFEESEFKNRINEYDGLEAIEEMATLVSSGSTIEEVASRFSLNEEQMTLLMLLFARNCYANADYQLGDRYLKQAEKRKNKTGRIKQLLDEIRKKKKFYRNQVSEGAKPFLLTR